MKDSLKKISKIIYSSLSENIELNEYCDKIFPLVIVKKQDENITSLMPFIIYKRDSFDSRYSKDGIYEDEVSFSLFIYTKSYNEGIEIASLIIEQFEGRKITYDDITMSDIKLDNSYEEYNDSYSAYIQILRFNTKIS